MTRRHVFIIAVLFSLLSPPAAHAFGTISGLGQNREHERITRHALDCTVATGLANCFQPRSTNEVAGGSGTFGAVGAPDNPARNLLTNSAAHCDNGDHLAVAGYPTSPGNPMTMLLGCRQWMEQHMSRAVIAAGRLILPDGTIDDSQIPTMITCTFLGGSGRAKCDVLEELGLVLHAAQDFYSHTNWTDERVAVPTVQNPPGLNNLGAAPFINLRVASPSFPPGLISGCFEFLPESVFCNDKPTGRVKHDFLNKDKGTIDGPGFVADTDRGRAGRNFERAVRAAIADTQDKWLILQERIRGTYGPARGDLMICALTNDDPAATCGAKGQKRWSPFNLFSSITITLGLLGTTGAIYFAGRAGRRAPRPA